MLCNNKTLASANESSKSAAAAGPDWNDQINYYIWVYVSPFIFFPGIIGNVLTAIVIRRPAFRNTTTSVYLLLIAIADTIVLVSGLLPDWLEWAQIVGLKEVDVWSCRVLKFVFYTSGDVSIWLIVAFTTDRFVAVCFPLSKRIVCVPRRAAVASAIIAFLGVSKNVHEFWTRGIQYDKLGQVKRLCGLPPEYFYFHAYVRPWIAFTVITALPFALILIFNCLIVRSLVIAQRMRALHAAGGTSTSGATGNRPASATSYRQTTLMCLSVSFAFLACILPSIILLIGKIHWDSPDAPRATLRAYKDAKSVNNLFVYVNHAVNFILYCLTGVKFRDELKATFGRPASNKKDALQAANNARRVSAPISGPAGQKSLVTGLSTAMTATTEVCAQDSDD